MGSPFYKDARAHLKTLLEGSQHLYKTVHPPISQSVHRSVCHTYVHQIKAKRSQEESLVITSSCNHFINMMTHRQPYGPRFIFLSTFVIIFHRLTKNMASFRDGRMLSQPPRSFIALSSSLLPPRFLLHFNNTKDCSFHSQTVNIVISSADESIMEQRSNRRTDKASYSDARTYLTMLLKATVIGSYGLPKPLGACITYHKSLSNQYVYLSFLPGLWTVLLKFWVNFFDFPVIPISQLSKNMY